ncbi:cyclopropane-fatty-acyl-phospholipid synthase family protein [uncultured Methanofollis sp.]|uniref:SAM-dependent methyltransferase n=1 Tax=uncultured Methanofollis sp. TaxID=262500 RepID=UPI0026295211|nr:class I SAM-dependent methyltransferase [uncultured Methanofollis sp.]
MEYFDLISISTSGMAIMNPTTPEKVTRAGAVAGLSAGDRVVEFGCGYGTILALWGKRFGIAGRGLDIREDACRRAVALLEKEGLSSQVEIARADVLNETPDGRYDCAACIGSSHIWGGFAGAIEAMSAWLKPDGRIVIGERYWARDNVPPEFARQWRDVLTEYEIVQAARDAGFDIAATFRASPDDWDTYESGNWQGLLAWLRDHPDGTEADEVREYLYRIQDEYAAYGREYMGFAIYVLVPF